MRFEVLIVDDEEILLMIYQRLTIKSGLNPKPSIFTKPSEALDYIFSINQEPAAFLILLDIHMPEINAWKFMDKLRNSSKNIDFYVAIITSSINQFDKNKAAEYREVIKFLEKPVDESSFKSILKLKKIEDLVSQSKNF